MKISSGRRFILSYLCLCLSLLFLFACFNQDDKEETKKGADLADLSKRQSEFISAGANQNPQGDGYKGNGTNEDAAAAPQTEENFSTAPQREIEEADIIKVEGAYLYILNQYRGLVICDLSTPDNPSILGRSSITGVPQEMYIKEDQGRAYIIVTGSTTDFPPPTGQAEDDIYAPESGSRVVVLDITNKQSPQILGQFDLDGQVTDSRIVGQILYVVSSEQPVYGVKYAETDAEERIETSAGSAGSPESPESDVKDAEEVEPVQTEETGEAEPSDQPQANIFVASIDLSDPTDIHQVDEEDFGGSSHYIHVSEQAIFVESNPDDSYNTTVITYIDISDPQGEIVSRGSIKVPGRLADEFKMNYYDGHLRVCTYQWLEIQGVSKLYVIDTNDPDNLQLEGNLELARGEQLFATRFDGNRAYLVTYLRKDPLWIIDLSDPNKPSVKGELIVPGWSTHIEPKADRLVALGVDDTKGWQVCVSLFDVADPNHPDLIKRVSLGDQNSWSTSSAYGDIHAFTVLDDLILLPYSVYDSSEGRQDERLQLIDYDPNSLVARGWVSQKGSVLRSRSLDNRLFSVSTDELQVINAEDRDNPVVTARLTLACNMIDFIPLDNDHGLQVIYETPDTYILRAVPLSNPEDDQGVSEFTLCSSTPPIFIANGHLIYAITSSYSPAYLNEPYESSSQILVVDFGNVAAPSKRGSLDLPGVYTNFKQADQQIGFSPYSDSGGQEEVVRVKSDLLVFNHVQSSYPILYGQVNGTAYTGTTDDVVKEDIIAPETSSMNEFLVIDLSDPNKPNLANKIPIEVASPTGLLAKNQVLYFSYSSDIGKDDQSRPQIKYYLGRIDLSDPYQAVELDPVNIPGICLGFDDAGTYTYTVNNEWTGPSSYEQKYSFNVIKIVDDTAYLFDSVQLPGYFSNAVINDGRAYLLRAGYGLYYRQLSFYPGYYNPANELTILDLADPQNLVTYQHKLSGWGFLSLLGAREGHILVSNYGTVICYQVTDPAKPQLDEFKISSGLNKVSFFNDKAYLPLGYYGLWVKEF